MTLGHPNPTHGVSAVAVTAVAALPVSAAGGSFAVSAAGGIAIPVSLAAQPIAVSAAGGAMSVSGQGTFNVSAQGGSHAVSAQRGWLGVAQETDFVARAGAAASAQTTAIETPASAGNHTVVPAMAAKVITVHSYALVVPGTAQVAFREGTAAGSKLTGSMPLMNGISVPHSPLGHFSTPVSHALQVHTDTASTVAGHLTFSYR